MNGYPLESSSGIVPFLKWPGGKRWIARKIAGLVRPRLSGNYIEPFLGGGSVFFQLRPTRAVLADINEDLVATFRAVRNRPAAVRATLAGYPISKPEYDRLRVSKPEGVIARAARMLYLNRTAFGGIYRVNSKGEFNVPFGGGERTTSILLESDVLEKASKALRAARIISSDFEPIIHAAGPGDVVYCDPTYTVAHNNNGFVRYNEKNFAWADQQRLSAAAFEAKIRGALVIISNADHSDIRKLYRKSSITVVRRFSSVCPAPRHRRVVDELLVIV